MFEDQHYAEESDDAVVTKTDLCLDELQQIEDLY